jgi:hypothetical protein
MLGRHYQYQYMMCNITVRSRPWSGKVQYNTEVYLPLGFSSSYGALERWDMEAMWGPPEA